MEEKVIIHRTIDYGESEPTITPEELLQYVAENGQEIQDEGEQDV